MTHTDFPDAVVCHKHFHFVSQFKQNNQSSHCSNGKDNVAINAWEGQSMYQLPLFV